MIRGVPVDNTLKTERLIDWYYREQMIEINKTLLLVAAINEVDDLQSFVKKYVDSVLPSGKVSEDFVKANAEMLRRESAKSYEIKAPG